MKKLILLFTIVVALVLNADAQTEKGKWILGGTAAYESAKRGADPKASQYLSIIPNIGYFVSDNFALGTGIGYSYQKTGFAIPTGQNDAVVINPFGRYYVSLSDQFKFFGQASVPLEFGTVKSVDVSGDTGVKTGSSTLIGVVLSPGFAFFPTKKIGVELALAGMAYRNYSVEDASGDKIANAGYETFSIGTNFFTPQVGIQFHF